MAQFDTVLRNKLSARGTIGLITEDAPFKEEFSAVLDVQEADEEYDNILSVPTISDTGVTVINETGIAMSVGATLIDPALTNPLVWARISTDLVTSSAVGSEMSEGLQVELDAVKRATFTKVVKQATVGTGSSGQMKGAAMHIDPALYGNEINKSFSALQLADLESISNDHFPAGRPQFFMTSSQGLPLVKALIRSSNYSPSCMHVPQLRGVRPAWDGIPVLINNAIPVSSYGSPPIYGTSLYAFSVGWGQGLCLLYTKGGVTLTKIIKPEEDQCRYRVSLTAALAVFGRGSIARISNFLI